MPEAARRVLEDCRIALKMLEDEGDPRRWRVAWIGTVALLRGVGHALIQYDCTSPERQKVSEEMQKEWQTGAAHEVFRKFIMNGQSLSVLEYEPKDPDKIDPVDFSNATDLFNPMMLDFSAFDLAHHRLPGDYRPGEDATLIVKDAILWWEQQLNEFDRKAGLRPVAKSLT